MKTEDFFKSLSIATSIEHLRDQCEALYVNQSLIDAKIEALTEIFWGVVANDTSATNPNYALGVKHLYGNYLGERVSALLNDSIYPLNQNSQQKITDFLVSVDGFLDEVEKEIEKNS